MRKLVRKELPSKEELAAKFDHLPWVQQLVLVLLYDWRFRLALLALTMVAVGFALVLLPVWRSTPPGFEPVHRVKMIDFWQARALRRTALAEIAAGRTRDGITTMRSAVSNNPGDLALVREFVDMMRQYGDPRHHTAMAVQNGLWLVQLSRTNLTELELVAGLFDRFLLDDFVVALLEPVEDKLSPALETAYAKALFMSRNPSRFAARWARLQARGIATDDPRLKLVHSAYMAGWTDGESAEAGQRALDDAKENAGSALLANRLQLIVSERRRDLVTYGRALENLIQMGATSLGDHLVYWQLLADSGQKDKAIELVRSNVYEPRTGDEAITLARVHYEFGLPEEARQVLYKYARHFAVADHLWLSLGNLLTTRGEWQSLGQIALEMRDESNPSRAELLCLSLYFEGLSELKQHRESTAEEAFQKAAQAPCENETILLKIASGMSEAGYPGPAQQLLLKNQRIAENNAEYWTLLGKVSYELRDLPTLAYAAAKTHSMRPNDPAAIQNHAAALLSMRSMPQEAIALTLELYRRQPNNPPAILNHAAALAQNRRLSDALRLLRSLDVSRLDESDRTTYYFVLTEILVEQGDYAKAEEAAKSVDRQFLFAPEIAWFDNALKRIQTKGENQASQTTDH
ncbi:MAG: hypothetical protein GX456_17510 [Verrucomicrobia bacterium]|nr:hypothetical protein [Verrucomicrobiota bacterium]